MYGVLRTATSRADPSRAACNPGKVRGAVVTVAGEASVDIAAWLHGLGMEQYEEAFRDNAIDAAVLPELTADDLKDLGVSLVGHRRKLLAAIAALRDDDRPAPTAPSPRSSGASTGLSPGTWATECSPISATRRRMRTTPSGRCGRVSAS